MRTLRAASALGLALAATPAPAADIGSFEQDGLTFLTVEGEFKPGDEAVFKRKLLETDAKVIVLASPGGALVVGIEIGRVARWQGLATIVPEGSICASACALAWLGGQPRFMAAGSRIGFHAAFRYDDGGAARETGSGNALVGSYVTQLGLSDEAIVYITQSAPEDMQWLTLADAASLGIAVRPLDGDAGGANPPAPTAEPEPAPAPAPAPAPVAEEEEPATQTCAVADVRPPDAYLALRSEPSSRRGRQILTMPKGTRFEMTGEQRGDWYAVRLAGGQTGWVSWEKRRWIAC